MGIRDWGLGVGHGRCDGVKGFRVSVEMEYGVLRDQVLIIMLQESGKCFSDFFG